MTQELYVDLARCQGHARCFSLAPETFTIDDEGYGHVIEGREESPEEERVRKAIKNCPERAIKLREVGEAA
jgi:ferredoxin